MGSLWKIAVAEYRRLAHKRSFLLSVIGMPVFIGIIIAIAVFTAMPERDARPIGYVDLAGVTQTGAAASYVPDVDAPEVLAFESEAVARAALESGAIQGFYLIPTDYLATRRLSILTWDKSPSDEARSAFETFLTAHLVAQAPAEAQKVLVDGVELHYRAAGAGREMAAGSFAVSAILPFIIGFFFLMVVMSSGGYLLQAVTTEKENRMVEVMITSVSPFQLIGGKALGLIGVALTQIGIWLVALTAALIWGRGQVDWLRDIALPGTTIALAALYFLPTYVLLAGLMIMVGSVVTDLQNGQQIAGFFNLVFMVPFFFIVLIFTNPDSPILVALTLFPTTSMMTIAMRWGVTTVPAWQLGLSFVLLIAAAVGSVWLAARVFRSGMLRYGQPISLAGLIEFVRPRRQAAPASVETGRMTS